jgi:hypothetical protein
MRWPSPARASMLWQPSSARTPPTSSTATGMGRRSADPLLPLPAPSSEPGETQFTDALGDELTTIVVNTPSTKKSRSTQDSPRRNVAQALTAASEACGQPPQTPPCGELSSSPCPSVSCQICLLVFCELGPHAQFHELRELRTRFAQTDSVDAQGQPFFCQWIASSSIGTISTWMFIASR